MCVWYCDNFNYYFHMPFVRLNRCVAFRFCCITYDPQSVLLWLVLVLITSSFWWNNYKYEFIICNVFAISMSKLVEFWYIAKYRIIIIIIWVSLDIPVVQAWLELYLLFVFYSVMLDPVYVQIVYLLWVDWFVLNWCRQLSVCIRICMFAALAIF